MTSLSLHEYWISFMVNRKAFYFFTVVECATSQISLQCPNEPIAMIPECLINTIRHGYFANLLECMSSFSWEWNYQLLLCKWNGESLSSLTARFPLHEPVHSLSGIPINCFPFSNSLLFLLLWHAGCHRPPNCFPRDGYSFPDVSNYEEFEQLWLFLDSMWHLVIG
jgi:hypothetical protein